jgi:hypothetical protein
MVRLQPEVRMKIVWVPIIVALALAAPPAAALSGYIDKSGKSVIEPRFDFVGGLSGGLARVTIGR